MRMRRGLSALAAASRPPQAQEQLDQRTDVAAENKKIKDNIAALCQKWRREGSPSHAAELERVMGWTPAGDPLTGCLPVTPD